MPRWSLVPILLCLLVLSACDSADADGDDCPLDVSDALTIEDLEVGTGTEVAPCAVVTIHYEGRLTNGDVFDSSYERGTPATFPLSNLIQGWQQGIPGMQVGGTRRLVIPPELGYGNRSVGSIPPNSTLIFDIELFDVQNP
ncbi:MAG: FKBP-type peptidyl-prolyl cis-trans isomerase [Bacteroidota bacterium]